MSESAQMDDARPLDSSRRQRKWPDPSDRPKRGKKWVTKASISNEKNSFGEGRLAAIDFDGGGIAAMSLL